MVLLPAGGGRGGRRIMWGLLVSGVVVCSELLCGVVVLVDTSW